MGGGGATGSGEESPCSMQCIVLGAWLAVGVELGGWEGLWSVGAWLGVLHSSGAWLTLGVAKRALGAWLGWGRG